MGKPLLVALCGRPRSGKSEVQQILHRNFGLIPVDDGGVLRSHCMELFDLSHDDVSTQEGKKRHTEIQGVDWENRKIVGEYGAALEKVFGELTVPNWAIRAAMKDWDERLQTPPGFKQIGNLPAPIGYSFGSVRRGQGAAYKQAGGVVIEIVRPGVEPTGNLWDEYDRKWIDHSFLNDTHRLEDLEDALGVFFESVLSRQDYHNTKRIAAE